MYKTVYDLTREELDELKQCIFDDYFYDIHGYEDCGDAEDWESWEDITDEEAKMAYADTMFSDDDFFCNQKGDNE